jgi:hypothetical protein
MRPSCRGVGVVVEVVRRLVEENCARPLREPLFPTAFTVVRAVEVGNPKPKPKSNANNVVVVEVVVL